VEVGRRATWEEVQALFVPRYLPFKRRPMPIPVKAKGGRYSKLKQAIKAENFHLLPASEPTCALEPHTERLLLVDGVAVRGLPPHTPG
jgi:hypothetical protein